MYSPRYPCFHFLTRHHTLLELVFPSPIFCLGIVCVWLSRIRVFQDSWRCPVVRGGVSTPHCVSRGEDVCMAVVAVYVVVTGGVLLSWYRRMAARFVHRRQRGTAACTFLLTWWNDEKIAETKRVNTNENKKCVHYSSSKPQYSVSRPSSPPHSMHS